ncbi:FAD-dependent oxidoreductase [Promicromonospora sp. NPDC050880]|uniref:FAD-dependent oxidoreductase n=1 Tax=Promicromonospora sp. NPDC050880 TaxID=3364406 RepID=UPI0037AA7BD7
MNEFDVVVVGHGAAAQAALRELEVNAPDLSTALVADAVGINRTLVTKGVLTGLLSTHQTGLPLLTDVERLEGPATGLEVVERRVHLSSGLAIGYRAVVIATGSAPRALDGPDLPLPVLHMHEPDDAARVRHLLGTVEPGPARVAILGAGLVGAETAAALRDAGARVHLIARSKRPLASALGPQIAGRVAELHREHVTAHLGATIDRGWSTGRDRGIVLDDGTKLELDLVIAAQGTSPRTAWTGADTSTGIRVDERLRWKAGTYAAGGAAVHTTANGKDYRIDQWDAATEQGRHGARTALFDLGLGDDPGPYVPRTGFTVRFHGATLTGVGVPAPDATRLSEDFRDGVAVTRFFGSSGRLVGAVALNAPLVARELAHSIARA